MRLRRLTSRRGLMDVRIDPDWPLHDIPAIIGSAERHGFKVLSIHTFHHHTEPLFGVLKIGERCGCRADLVEFDILTINLPLAQWYQAEELVEEFFSLHRHEDRIVDSVIQQEVLRSNTYDAFGILLARIHEHRKDKKLTISWPEPLFSRFQQEFERASRDCGAHAPGFGH